MSPRSILHGLVACIGLAGFATQLAAATEQARVLMIGIDAMPYEVVRQLSDPGLGDAALFKALRGPAAIVNTFPSMSYSAWTALLQPFGVARPAGYKGRYFDLADGSISTATGPDGVRAPWREFFDWRLEGVRGKAAAFTRSRHTSRREIREGLEAFLASDRPIFFMYIMSTDALAHLHGPDGLREFLRELDSALTRFRSDHPESAFHTVLVSDHGVAGDEPLENIWPEVSDAVKAAGFRVSRKIRGERDVVFIPLGLVSNFVIYTREERASDVAAIVAAVPGVDVCVMSNQDGWQVVGARGNAVISRRGNEERVEWSYQTRGGDPLGYDEVLGALRKRAGDQSALWFPDSWWFEATVDHVYPDALHRLAHSFQLADNPPSVHCSVSPGYMYGALRAELVMIPTVGRLQWTHGALHRTASLGFLMSDLPQWTAPQAVRSTRALEFLAATAKQRTLHAARSE